MKSRSSWRKSFSLILLTIIVSSVLFAPWLTPYIPGKMDISQRLLPPSTEHWLGTDTRGIDVWTSLLYGGRLSLGISVCTVLVSTIIGVSAGLLAGFFGKIWDQILMRTVDVLMAFPGILLSLAISSLLPPSTFSLIAAMTATGWIGPARLVRAEILSLKERDFIMAARALGVPPLSMLFRHLFPHVFSLIITHMTLSISSVIIVESSLNFLGLGPHALVPTWGQLLNEGRTVMLRAPTLTLAPGFIIFVLVFAIHLLGDSLQDQKRSGLLRKTYEETV